VSFRLRTGTGADAAARVRAVLCAQERWLGVLLPLRDAFLVCKAAKMQYYYIYL